MPTLPPMPAPAPPPEVRFVLAAPSPYTGRFDATRAGLGIALELHRIAREHQLPLRIGFRALPMQAGQRMEPHPSKIGRRWIAYFN